MKSYNICSLPILSVIFHCHCLEILWNFGKRAPPFSLCTGPLTKLCSWSYCEWHLCLLHTKNTSLCPSVRWITDEMAHYPPQSIRILLTDGTVCIALWYFLFKSVFPARGNVYVLLTLVSFVLGVAPELCFPPQKCICRSSHPNCDNI